jgi:hypothetical protein
MWWSHLKVYNSIQVWRIGICFWYCWKDLDEQDLMKFILQVLDLRRGRYQILSVPSHWMHILFVNLVITVFGLNYEGICKE